MFTRLLLVLLLLPGTSAMASSIEEPEYQLLDTLDRVELRRYAPSIQATTTLTSNRQSTVGFQRLAGYIFGGNATGESISMTAPVQETLVNQHPVMAFTMPSAYSMDTLPEPSNRDVVLQEMPERVVATLPFGGWASPLKVKRTTEQLLNTLQANGVQVVGPPALNQYNPPWTLPFLRRNEIEVEISFDYLAGR